MSVSEQGVREYEESYSELDLEKLEALEVLALDSSSVKTMVPELARVSKERTVSLVEVALRPLIPVARRSIILSPAN